MQILGEQEEQKMAHPPGTATHGHLLGEWLLCLDAALSTSASSSSSTPTSVPAPTARARGGCVPSAFHAPSTVIRKLQQHRAVLRVSTRPRAVPVVRCRCFFGFTWGEGGGSYSKRRKLRIRCETRRRHTGGCEGRGRVRRGASAGEDEKVHKPIRVRHHEGCIFFWLLVGPEGPGFPSVVLPV